MIEQIVDYNLVKREDYEDLTGEVVKDVRLAPRACPHYLHNVRVGQLPRHSHLLRDNFGCKAKCILGRMWV